MKFSKPIRKGPFGQDVLDRVRAVFQGQGVKEYTLPHIVEKVRPVSVEDVARALAELTNKSEVEKILRVESPANAGGLADFQNAQEIPEEMYDFRAARQFRVRPENIRVIFRRKSSTRGHV